MSLPLGRVVSAAAATVTTGAITIRTVDGYAWTKAQSAGGKYSGIDITDFSPVCVLQKGTGNVRIKISNSTKWTTYKGEVITNNTPVTLSCNFTIQFS